MKAKIFACPHCGASVNQGVKFCPHCGEVLRPTGPNDSSAARFWHFLVQFLLAMGAIVFGGVGACLAYALATRQTVSSDIGDLSGIYWTVGIIALSCCAACLYFALRRKF